MRFLKTFSILTILTLGLYWILPSSEDNLKTAASCSDHHHGYDFQSQDQ